MQDRSEWVKAQELGLNEGKSQLRCKWNWDLDCGFHLFWFNSTARCLSSMWTFTVTARLVAIFQSVPLFTKLIAFHLFSTYFPISWMAAWYLRYIAGAAKPQWSARSVTPRGTEDNTEPLVYKQTLTHLCCCFCSLKAPGALLRAILWLLFVNGTVNSRRWLLPTTTITLVTY